MGMFAGIEIASAAMATLRRLTDFHEALANALLELSEAKEEDLDLQHYQEIQVLKATYLALTLEVDRDGELAIPLGKDKDIALQLVKLCQRIIAHNRQHLARQ